MGTNNMCNCAMGKKNGKFKLFGEFLAVAACTTLGYVVGQKVHERQLAKGLTNICENDPSLKEHLITAVLDYKKKTFLE